MISKLSLETISRSARRVLYLKEDGLYENLQTDEGIRREQSHIYFVDDSHQIYPYADVAYGYKLPDEDMVYQNYLTGYAGHSLYTFSDLYKKAQ